MKEFASPFVGVKIEVPEALLGVGLTKVSYKTTTPVKCIMNDPATILFFSDGQKVVSKAHGGDTYDPLFGIMACALRKTSNNRERIDNWEVVIAFLSCFLADAKECRAIANMLNTTADTLELDGVGDQVIGCDVSDSAFEKALYENEVW